MASSSTPPPQPPVSREQVLRVAELAQLELTPEEISAMLRDLNSVLSHVAQLNQLDTTKVPAMTQVSELLPSGSPVDSRNHLREDSERPSLERAIVMAEAPDSDGAFFRVPKVIDR